MGALSTLLAIFALYISFNEIGESRKFNHNLETNIEDLKTELKELDESTKKIENITMKIDSQNFSKAEDLMNEFKNYYNEEKEGENKITNEEVEYLSDNFLEFYKGYNILSNNTGNISNINGSSQVRQFIYNTYSKDDYINRQDIIKKFEKNNDITEGMISGVIHKLLNSNELKREGRGRYKKLI